ncbi:MULTISPECIES: benzoate/H(+) symporter BenE family transporter [unclassified Pantoea]|uniref:benzoate/H(+) symporter BenE family transporter n=1 Tax=unclassified Pantoea TaxID=2630326 RepID=UPI0023DB376A|nr:MULTISPECIES: benzoate/H(+) symporter BenE family transporter [unclassified Pantoea]MDF2040870.1 benzoate/H(+) symporter BenE family transporter [Pantoea sp. Cr_R14]MDF2071277.1 benzoate/H(+) symporter BenE family transporter [Pantoea sp. Cr_R13]MDF2080406.1 benzoate/H(+) symporter BenE family transporter [Pantoea sp. Cr_R21]
MTRAESSRFTLPMLVSGFVAVLVGYSSTGAIIYQMFQAAGASPAQIGGWLSVLGLAQGIVSIGLSLRYRMPVLAAWSTPGAALLATSFNGISLNEAFGVFVFANLLIVVSGVTGLFARLMNHIPASLAAAMLAGILLRFGLQTFADLQSNFVLCGSMCLAWLLARRWLTRYAILVTLLVGVVIALAQHAIHFPQQSIMLSLPEPVMPHFTLATLLGMGVPYFLVTMASQNAPGIATLQAHGYRPLVSSLMSWTGLTALLLSPFGGFSICVAAITAAICMSDEVDENPQQRWRAAVLAGIFYLLAGVSGALIAVLFSALPAVLIEALAGLALLATLGGSLHRALDVPAERDSALVTFLITASGVSLLGIGPAFWGLAGGIIAHLVLVRRTV